MALLTFMKATKTRLDSLPSAATRVPFEVCCEFPGCEKDIYKASTACSGTEDISPQGQLNKWQSSPAAASCKRESHQFTGFRWLRQKPPGRKSCCANLFPCCFLCCKFFAETIHLLSAVKVWGDRVLLWLDLRSAWFFSQVLSRNPKAKLVLSKLL